MDKDLSALKDPEDVEDDEDDLDEAREEADEQDIEEEDPTNPEMELTEAEIKAGHLAVQKVRVISVD